MSPFDLRGPAFLLFYLVSGGALLVGLALWRRRSEGGPMPKVTLSDPYQIAYLREGPLEAVRICLVSLADRGLLRDEDGLLRASPEAPGIVRRPLERRVLERFASPQRPEAVLEDPSIKAEADQIGTELTRTGLLPDEETTRARHGRTVLVMGLLVALAVTKVIVALARGRTNVLFLIILGVVMTGLAWAIGHPRRTLLGDRLVADLRTLFAGLRGRAPSLRPGGATAEAALVAAVFGLASLSRADFPVAHRLERARAAASSSGGSSCGSSSCGSSCGGGGGGCGGCGS